MAVGAWNMMQHGWEVGKCQLWERHDIIQAALRSSDSINRLSCWLALLRRSTEITRLILLLETGDARVTFPWVSSVTSDEFYCNSLRQATTASQKLLLDFSLTAILIRDALASRSCRIRKNSIYRNATLTGIPFKFTSCDVACESLIHSRYVMFHVNISADGFPHSVPLSFTRSQ
jgi:hypothetical protein